jgi:hypothetical protein
LSVSRKRRKPWVNPSVRVLTESSCQPRKNAAEAACPVRVFTKRTPGGRVGLRPTRGQIANLIANLSPHGDRYTAVVALTSVNIQFSTSLARWATPAVENGWPNGVDTLLLRRVGTGCEPVIRIVKERWRLSPVAFRCLSTASVLHLEKHFRGKDLSAGALRRDGRWNPVGKYHTARRKRCGCNGHRCW